MRSLAVASLQLASPLWELTCHTGSHSIACHPTVVTFAPLPDLATPEECKDEWVWLHTEVVYQPQYGHPPQY